MSLRTDNGRVEWPGAGGPRWWSSDLLGRPQPVRWHRPDWADVRGGNDGRRRHDVGRAHGHRALVREQGSAARDRGLLGHRGRVHPCGAVPRGDLLPRGVLLLRRPVRRLAPGPGVRGRRRHPAGCGGPGEPSSGSSALPVAGSGGDHRARPVRLRARGPAGVVLRRTRHPLHGHRGHQSRPARRHLRGDELRTAADDSVRRAAAHVSDRTAGPVGRPRAAAVAALHDVRVPQRRDVAGGERLRRRVLRDRPGVPGPDRSGVRGVAGAASRVRARGVLVVGRGVPVCGPHRCADPTADPDQR